MVLLAGVFFVCAMTLLGLLGWGLASTWLIDLSSHFPLQYMLLLAVSLPLILLLRRSRLYSRGTATLLSLVLVCFAINLAHVAPYFMAKRPVVQSAQLSGSLKLMHINLLWVNRSVDRVSEAIAAKNPDIISFAEYTDWWNDALSASGSLKRYAYRTVVMDGAASFAVYSKRPLRDAQVEYVGEDANMTVHFSVGGQPVTLLAAHPRPPITPGFHARQMRQMASWVTERKRLGENLIVVGDMNATPWSQTLGAVLRKTDLHDTQQGFGLQPSWPSMMPVLYIPIDHVLVSDGFVTLKRQTGPFVGSDHLPVYVELGLRSRPGRETARAH